MVSSRTRLAFGLGAAAVVGGIAFVAATPATIGPVLAGTDPARFGLVCALQLLSLVLCGAAWRLLADGATLLGCTGARLVRDGASTLGGFLPGIGEVVGARVLTLFGTTSGDAAASTVVDTVTETISQVVFTVCGLAAVAVLLGGDALAGGAQIAAAAGASALGLFVLSRNRTVLGWLERCLGWFGRVAGFDGGGRSLDLAANVSRIYARPGRVAAATMIHLGAWFLGAVQVWVAADAIGRPLGFGASLALVSLGYAARAILFVVPLGAGVQEVTFLLVGRALGADEAGAVALSLVLRARDVLLAVPAVLGWGAAEFRRLPARSLRRRPGRATSGEIPRVP